MTTTKPQNKATAPDGAGSELTRLLCCPFCGSGDVEDDYDAVQTTFTGTRENPTGWHEYQNGWVDCNTCGAQGPHVRAKDEQIDKINDMTRDAWNKAPRERLVMLKRLNEMIAIQCGDGNWNYDPYMHGMANGMIFARFLLDGKAPEYLEAPETWLKDTMADPGALREITVAT